MLTREMILQTLRDNAGYLAAEYGVARIGLFGSYARGTADEASDVDIVAEFQRPIGLKFVELAEYLERLLGKQVDILTPVGIQNIRVSRVAQSIAEDIVYA